jgi:hypothetical protein
MPYIWRQRTSHLAKTAFLWLEGKLTNLPEDGNVKTTLKRRPFIRKQRTCRLNPSADALPYTAHSTSPDSVILSLSSPQSSRGRPQHRGDPRSAAGRRSSPDSQTPRAPRPSLTLPRPRNAAPPFPVNHPPLPPGRQRAGAGRGGGAKVWRGEVGGAGFRVTRPRSTGVCTRVSAEALGLRQEAGSSVAVNQGVWGLVQGHQESFTVLPFSLTLFPRSWTARVPLPRPFRRPRVAAPALPPPSVPDLVLAPLEAPSVRDPANAERVTAGENKPLRLCQATCWNRCSAPCRNVCF